MIPNIYFSHDVRFVIWDGYPLSFFVYLYTQLADQINAWNLKVSLINISPGFSQVMQPKIAM